MNFGGPRSKEEIFPFLKALLNDRDVIWSGLPSLLHRLLFTRVAKKRSVKIAPDYDLIGGKSPIYEDTEALAIEVGKCLNAPVRTFHRYIPATHAEFLKKICEDTADEIRIFPLFPQFSYATTGSIARFFVDNLPWQVVRKMRWLFSYAADEGYIAVMEQTLRQFLQANNLIEEETLLFFSAHGVPKRFVCMGDPYQTDCESSYRLIRAAFPKALSLLAYQSKFGPGEWLRPYTVDICTEIEGVSQDRKNIVFVPLTFTTDHIETLFEVETLYLPLITKKGLKAFRCPALNQRPDWIQVIARLMQREDLIPTQMLVRPKQEKCCSSRKPACLA
ncbi:MAG: ferrochelatase [Rhabdochlamydiaceae bacterium]